MKKKQKPDLQEDFRDDADPENAASVDDFLRQLEAKEKDLHITADLSIEIEESEFDYSSMPDFVAAELKASQQESMPKQGPAGSSEQRLTSEIAALKNQVSELKAERLKLVDRNKQGLREFDNFKNRMERERSATFASQVSNLAVSMLPVLDNLDRALDFAAKLDEIRSEEFKHFFDGIVLVNQQIVEVLAGMGVLPIATVGEQFDPQFHEAVAIEASEDFPLNTIIEELMRGYRIGDKIIRHSMVKVVGGGEAEKLRETISENEAEPGCDNLESENREPLPGMDEEVEELIASSYADRAEGEQGN